MVNDTEVKKIHDIVDVLNTTAEDTNMEDLPLISVYADDSIAIVMPEVMLYNTDEDDPEIELSVDYVRKEIVRYARQLLTAFDDTAKALQHARDANGDDNGATLEVKVTAGQPVQFDKNSNKSMAEQVLESMEKSKTAEALPLGKKARSALESLLDEQSDDESRLIFWLGMTSIKTGQSMMHYGPTTDPYELLKIDTERTGSLSEAMPTIFAAASGKQAQPLLWFNPAKTKWQLFKTFAKAMKK